MKLIDAESTRLVRGLIERHAPREVMTGVGPIVECQTCLVSHPCQERRFLANYLRVTVAELDERVVGAPLYMTREQAVYRAWALAQRTRGKTATYRYMDFTTGLTRSVTWTPQSVVAR